MTVLQEINRRKAEHVAEMRKKNPQELLNEKIQKAEKPRGFINALKNYKAPAIIAEIKKASPSQGVIRADFKPAQIAKIYEENGAACISCLTDEPYFQGQDEYLIQVKAASKLPVLRKDFMINPYQIYESRALGADCVLLIMASLSDDQAQEMYTLSTDLGMDVLVEIHDEAELKRALTFSPSMIGINNRNLKTLEVDINTSHKLAALLPPDVLKVAESGISKPESIQALQKDGFTAFLIGESLMRQDDIGAGLRNLQS